MFIGKLATAAALLLRLRNRFVAVGHRSSHSRPRRINFLSMLQPASASTPIRHNRNGK